VAVASAGLVQVCTSLQTDNHASTPTLSFLQAGRPSCRPTNSVIALKAQIERILSTDFLLKISCNLEYSQFHTFFIQYTIAMYFKKSFLILNGTTAFCQAVN